MCEIKMKKDKRFEIQYIISLTLLALGFVTAPLLSKWIQPIIPYLFLAFAGIHIVLFNTAYMFDKMTEFKTQKVENLLKWSDHTLKILSIAFTYFITYLFVELVFSYATLDPITLNGLEINQLLKYIIPLIITLIIVYYGWRIKKIQLKFKNINVNFEPKKIDIFSNYEDTDPIFFKIENRTDDEKEFRIEMDFPKDVIYKIQRGREDESGEFDEKIRIDGQAQKTNNFELKYCGDVKRSDQIKIKVTRLDKDKGIYEDKIQAVLDPT